MQLGPFNLSDMLDSGLVPKDKPIFNDNYQVQKFDGYFG